MDLGIEGRTALVTGGDSGIGWHSARTLLGEGARIALTDLDQNEFDAAADRLDAQPGSLVAVAADVTSPASLGRLHTRVRDTLGEIDILVHCAGVTGAQGAFHEISDEGRANTIETDLLGAVRVVREFLPDLRHGGWGRLVLLASADAVQPDDGELPYCAAKAGVLALSKGLSRTHAREGLLVKAVSPAFIHTPMTDAMMDRRSQQLGVPPDQAVESFLDQERPFMELGRRGRPEEVAAVIAFLCADRASFVNGSNYRVDSGSVVTI